MTQYRKRAIDGGRTVKKLIWNDPARSSWMVYRCISSSSEGAKPRKIFIYSVDHFFLLSTRVYCWFLLFAMLSSIRPWEEKREFFLSPFHSLFLSPRFFASANKQIVKSTTTDGRHNKSSKTRNMASLLKLFLTLEPSLRFYLRSQRVAEVHEALISSLLVCQPDDPIAWLLSCLLELDSLPASTKINLEWNHFIPEIYQPVNRPLNIESSLSYIFAVCDDTLEPNERQIGLAIEHYKQHMQRKLFYAWLRYYLNRLGQRRWIERRERAAEEYYRVRLLNLYFRQWSQWGLRTVDSFFFQSELSLSLVSHRLARQKAAVAHINHCSETYQLRILIHEWNLVAQQARRTRDYFDRLERGEENQQNHGFVSQCIRIFRSVLVERFSFEGHGEARDEMSLLTREAAVRILAYLDVADLARCAQVDRTCHLQDI